MTEKEELYCKQGRKGWQVMVFFTALILFVTVAPFATLNGFDGMKSITGGAQAQLAPATPIIVNSLSTLAYLAVVLVMPVFLIGVGGYMLMKYKPKFTPQIDHNAEQNIHDMNYSSMDHEFHLFPHVDQLIKPTSEQTTQQATQAVAYRSNNDYENAVLQPFLKQELLKGKTTQELHTHLGTFGWEKDTINLALRDMDMDHTEVEMVLSSYVMRCLSEGNNLGTIKDALHAKGWHKPTVEKVFNKVQNYVLNDE